MNVAYPVTELGAIATLFDCLHKTPSYSEDGYPMVRVTDIKSGFLDLSGTLRVHEKTYKEFIKRHKPRTGDILLTRVGSYGNSSYVDRDQDFCLGQNTVCIAPDRQKIDPYFLYCCLNMPSVKKQMDSFVVGSSQPTISLRNISLLRIPLPDIVIQRKIASILSEVDNSIEKSGEIITKTQQLKKGLMQQLFTKGIGHTKFKQTDIGEMPLEWEAAKLGDFAEIRSGYSFKSSYYVKEGIPLIRIANIAHGKMNMDHLAFLPNEFLQRHSDFALKGGDLVIVLTRPIIGGGLKAARIAEKHVPALLNQRVGKITIRDKEQLLPWYLFHFLFSASFYSQVRHSLTVMNQPNISPFDMERFTIPLPPPNEQHKIAEILSSIDAKIDAEFRNKERMDTIKRGLMSVLLTGKLRVKEI